ncbi:coenzyme A pyrophosphatase [Flavobacterium faecale]|uniref:Coenzyme A pyrophosphatase n=1 Tax=Flavobacterium faecale TaxID=1355330 RepID=A0A2S1LI72_9FLAO|nr:CoA pyrophosphatase [Flavobacterium faecale]AWG23429.1 coenzyme A pyrophosphatase [Flavobacterium faecale]
MDFSYFLEIVPHIVSASLPAAASHAKMAPMERMEELLKIDISKKMPRKAAVLMLFYPKGTQTTIVLIVRNVYEGVHSGQIAFPGGKYEIEDRDLSFTALRETHEEVGVIPDLVEIKKDFTPIYIPPSNFMVHPFLGISNTELDFTPDPSEVARIIELPLDVFLKDEILVNVTIPTSYAEEIEVPAFQIEEQIVWGATAMILSELKDVIKSVLQSQRGQ